MKLLIPGTKEAVTINRTMFWSKVHISMYSNYHYKDAMHPYTLWEKNLHPKKPSWYWNGALIMLMGNPYVDMMIYFYRNFPQTNCQLEPLSRNFSEMSIKILLFYFEDMYLETSIFSFEITIECMVPLLKLYTK